jgi:hypothetical protein
MKCLFGDETKKRDLQLQQKKQKIGCVHYSLKKYTLVGLIFKKIAFVVQFF